MAATGIDIGDAILTFLADTTQLDQAITRVNAEVASKLKPSGQAVEDLGKTFAASGQSAQAAATQATAFAATTTVAGQKASNALQQTKLQADSLKLALGQVGSGAAAGLAPGSEAIEELKAQIVTLEAEIARLELEVKTLGPAFQEAGAQASFSMREATGSVGLLGEATGVQLPRHVRRFLAELPGVGAALESAFSAVAVYFLIEALIQGAEKLTEFISETFIFTEAMKKSDEITAKMNEDLLKHSEAIRKLKDDYALLGLSGIAKTSEQIALLNQQIKENTEGLGELQRKALGGDAQAQADFLTRTANAKELQQQLTNLEKEGALERQAEIRKAALAAVDIERDRQISIVALKAEENRSIAAAENSGVAALSAIEARHQLDLYNIQLGGLLQRQQLLKTDKTTDPSLIKQINEQIEALQRDHATALIKIYADTIAGINALGIAGSGRSGLGDQILGTDFNDKFEQAEQAATDLGFTLSGTLAENVDKAKEAYDRLKDSGVASLSDIYRAQILVLQGQIQLAKDSGESFGPLLKQLNAIQEQYDKLTGAISRTTRQSKDFLQEIKKDQAGALNVNKSLTSTLGEAFNQLAVGIETAISAAILGQKSLGEALRESVAQALAAYAAQEAVKAIIYTAEAFAALAAFDYAAAGNFFTAAAYAGAAAAAAGTAAHFLAPQTSNTGSSSSASSTSGGQVSAQQPEQQPIQTVNTQHFASGGLITQRTLAVIGDAATGAGSQREAVIPVDDARFMDAVAGGLAQRIGPSGNVTHITFHVEGLVSADHLHKFVKKMNQGINKGSVRLSSSNSLRVTRRS
jgi:hypothetical protein